MSFTPGENGGTPGVASVASDIGSGISVQAINNVDYVSLDLVAGANITLTPSLVDNSITISSSGGGGGIASVSASANSGITATTVGSAVTLGSALVAGSNISFQNGTGNNLIINNTQTLNTYNGSGINISQVNSSNFIVTNLVSGNGISLSPSTSNTGLTINNTGVIGINAGSNISVSSAGGVVTIDASDITYTAGTGLSLSNTQFNNTGVLSVTPGSGLALVGGSNGNVTIQNSGVLGLTAGSGISVSGTSNPTISNTGVLGIVQGNNMNITSSNGIYTLNAIDTIGTITGQSGIAVSQVGANVTLSNTGVLTTGVASGITNVGTAQNPVLANSGVLSVTAGSNVTLTGTAQNPQINVASVTPLTAGTGISITSNAINNTGVLGITSPVPGISIGGTAQNPTITNTGVVTIGAGQGISISGNSNLPVITNSGVTSLTAGAGISLSSASGAVTISSTAGTPVNYTQNVYQVQTSLPNDSTTVRQYGFAMPSWWGPSNNSFMRMTLLLYEPAGQAWTGALGGLNVQIRYYPGGAFAPSLLYLPQLVKPSGATTLRYVADLIQFNGVPGAQGQGPNALELTNFSANPNISNVYITVQFEFYQFSSPPIVQYQQAWPGVATGQGNYMMTDYSVGYFYTT